MGGHGHAKPVKVPSPDIYKVEDVPELKALQERLAAKGLKDPWLRNEVWRYRPEFGTRASRARLLLRGWKLGIPAFIITLGIETLLGTDSKSHSEHGGH